MIYPVVADMLVNVSQILARSGASVAFLAQPPGEIARVRESNRDVLVTAVVSDQRGAWAPCKVSSASAFCLAADRWC